MWHKLCRTFHPRCSCIKTRCLAFQLPLNAPHSHHPHGKVPYDTEQPNSDRPVYNVHSKLVPSIRSRLQFINCYMYLFHNSHVISMFLPYSYSYESFVHFILMFCTAFHRYASIRNIASQSGILNLKPMKVYPSQISNDFIVFIHVSQTMMPQNITLSYRIFCRGLGGIKNNFDKKYLKNHKNPLVFFNRAEWRTGFKSRKNILRIRWPKESLAS